MNLIPMNHDTITNCISIYNQITVRPTDYRTLQRIQSPAFHLYSKEKVRLALKLENKTSQQQQQ